MLPVIVLHKSKINYLNTQIKTNEAQLDSTHFENPLAKAPTNYHRNLQNELRDLNAELRGAHLRFTYQTYLAELEIDNLNPHKPPKELSQIAN